MAKGIRLHPQYGLNPTMPSCFWCGGTRNEIALLGAAYKGEALRNMVIDYEPCNECKEKMATGFLLVEVTDKASDHRPAINRNPEAFPTGRWCVIKNEAADRLFPNVDRSQGKALISKELAEKIGLY